MKYIWLKSVKLIYDLASKKATPCSAVVHALSYRLKNAYNDITFLDLGA